MVSVINLMDSRVSPSFWACLREITMTMLTVGVAGILDYMCAE